MARVQTLHQVLARKKKEKNISGQPMDQLKGDADVPVRLIGAEEQGDHRQQQNPPTIICGKAGKKSGSGKITDPGIRRMLNSHLPSVFGSPRSI
jgi:hypothetical protein